MGVIQLKIYEDKRGKRPFESWKKRLGKTASQVVSLRLARLRGGQFGDCKPLKGVRGLFEMRIHNGPGYRIYYGRVKGEIVLLLCGGDKGSQKRDIEKAKAYWDDYIG